MFVCHLPDGCSSNKPRPGWWMSDNVLLSLRQRELCSSSSMVREQPMIFLGWVDDTLQCLLLGHHAAAIPNRSTVGQNALNGDALTGHWQSLSSVVLAELSPEFKSLLGHFSSAVMGRLWLRRLCNDLEVGGSNPTSSLCPWPRQYTLTWSQKDWKHLAWQQQPYWWINLNVRGFCAVFCGTIMVLEKYYISAVQLRTFFGVNFQEAEVCHIVHTFPIQSVVSSVSK